MDTLWDWKSFEVGGHWPLWRGWKTRMTTQNRQKSYAYQTSTNKSSARFVLLKNIICTWFMSTTFSSPVIQRV